MPYINMNIIEPKRAKELYYTILSEMLNPTDMTDFLWLALNLREIADAVN